MSRRKLVVEALHPHVAIPRSAGAVAHAVAHQAAEWHASGWRPEMLPSTVRWEDPRSGPLECSEGVCSLFVVWQAPTALAATGKGSCVDLVTALARPGDRVGAVRNASVGWHVFLERDGKRIDPSVDRGMPTPDDSQYEGAVYAVVPDYGSFAAPLVAGLDPDPYAKGPEATPDEGEDEDEDEVIIAAEAGDVVAGLGEDVVGVLGIDDAIVAGFAAFAAALAAFFGASKGLVDLIKDISSGNQDDNTAAVLATMARNGRLLHIIDKSQPGSPLSSPELMRAIAELINSRALAWAEAHKDDADPTTRMRAQQLEAVFAATNADVLKFADSILAVTRAAQEAAASGQELTDNQRRAQELATMFYARTLTASMQEGSGLPAPPTTASPPVPMTAPRTTFVETSTGRIVAGLDQLTRTVRVKRPRGSGCPGGCSIA